MILRKLYRFFLSNGPLRTIERVCYYMQNHFGKFPGIVTSFSYVLRLLSTLQQYLDAKFDRLYGTNTSGTIAIKDLAISSVNLELAIWYEPMSVKVFTQIMDKLKITFHEFVFIDFGSGKGRVLFLAYFYGFKNIIGVEFAKELNKTAQENVSIFDRKTKQNTKIQCICEDATNFSIPNEPLVIFFYSPFKGKVMETVLNNISKSLANHRRKIFLIFHGNNEDSIDLLKRTNFVCEELKLSGDWSRIKNYRSFLFTSL